MLGAVQSADAVQCVGFHEEMDAVASVEQVGLIVRAVKIDRHPHRLEPVHQFRGAAAQGGGFGVGHEAGKDKATLVVPRRALVGTCQR